MTFPNYPLHAVSEFIQVSDLVVDQPRLKYDPCSRDFSLIRTVLGEDSAVIDIGAFHNGCLNNRTLNCFLTITVIVKFVLLKNLPIITSVCSCSQTIVSFFILPSRNQQHFWRPLDVSIFWHFLTPHVTFYVMNNIVLKNLNSLINLQKLSLNFNEFLLPWPLKSECNKGLKFRQHF